MKFNGKLDIAVGDSRTTVRWSNESWAWDKLSKKLTTAHYTNVTQDRYEAASKQDQGKIKDVGGYVGGYLRNGRRKPENVGHRQLITLDIDFGKADFWEDIVMQFENAAVIHTTHSHTPENPKYRLIMPLSRTVSPDEYEAIARRIAGQLDIEVFDNTSFQPYRLMYWPATPKDATFISEFQDGPWLNADAILDSYIDWKDVSLWPISKTASERIQTEADKQQDPRDKRGIIGAFARTYSITEALEEFLSDEYTHYTDDRYSYTKGSTAGGLVVYDDKFAYSHHGTDPVGGMLVNVFDLVRMHKFGYMDEDSMAKGTKLPSFKAVADFCQKDKRVLATIAEETLENAKYVFAEGNEDYDPTTPPRPASATEEATAPDLDWMQDLDIGSQGKYLSTATNVNMIMANDPWLKGAFRYNAFENRRYIFQNVPWRRIKEPEPFKDVDTSGLRNYLETVYGITGSAKIVDCLALEFERYSFHPVRDYFKSLEWDGKERIETLMIDYFGAEDNIYVRQSIRKMLVAGVGRIMKPGIKFDLMMVLVGGQGIGKSTFLRTLSNGWFSDSLISVHGNAAMEALQGVLIVEMAELSAIRQADVEPVKQFVSRQVDSFRPAYGKTKEDFYRQNIFFGTTNTHGFLRDYSGNRRFLPVDARPENATKDVHAITQQEVDQWWAEAVHYFNQGEKLFLTRAAENIAKVEQRSHRELDQRDGLIQQYLDVLLPDNWEDMDVYQRRMYLSNVDEQNGTKLRTTVCVAEIWCECLENEKNDMRQWKTKDINDILRGMEEWIPNKSTKTYSIYGKQRYYTRSDWAT